MAASLQAENELLAAIIEDLHKPRGKDHDSSLLRQTEDALLDMHAENKATRNALAAESEQLHVTCAALDESKRSTFELQQRLRQQSLQHVATERALILELDHIERQWACSTEASYIAQLREAADTAVRGMHEAQAECKWLHGQLQAVLGEGGDGEEGDEDGGARGGTHSQERGGRRSTLHLHLDAPAGSDSADAMRTAYVRAVQRCHELQVHAARLSDEGERMRPQLVRALERVASLQAEVDALRSGVPPSSSRALLGGATDSSLLGLDLNADDDGPSPAGAGYGGATLAAAAPLFTELPSPPLAKSTPLPPSRHARAQPGSSGAARAEYSVRGLGGAPHRPSSAAAAAMAAATAAAGARWSGSRNGRPAMSGEGTLRAACARLQAQVHELEHELRRRRAEHQADLDALCAAQKDAGESARILRSEREWVAALDQMRVADLKTIQTLEDRLKQWATWHPTPEPPGARRLTIATPLPPPPR